MQNRLEGMDGISPSWGDSPTERGIVLSEKFEPVHVMAVYISFDLNGQKPKTKIRHGYQPVGIGGSTQAIAEGILKEASRGSHTSWQNRGAHKQDRRELDFEYFTMDCPTAIYVMIDNENIRFDDRKLAIGDEPAPAHPNNMVRFTQYSDSGQLMTKNRSFYNASLKHLQDTGPFKAEKVLYIENWCRDEHGNPVIVSERAAEENNGDWYSMNFHLLLKTENGGEIPIIVDPDTGNGQGNGPPEP